MGCHSLLQGIFLIQGSNLCFLRLLHLLLWWVDSLPPAPPGESIIKWLLILYDWCHYERRRQRQTDKADRRVMERQSVELCSRKPRKAKGCWCEKEQNNATWSHMEELGYDQLERAALREVSQTEEDKYHILFIGEI